MKVRLLRFFSKMTGNPLAQRLLERYVRIAQYMMGIGAGSDVASSGERVLVEYMRRLHRTKTESLCIFDVGANEGQFLKFMIEGLNGVPATFHSFEPARSSFNVLSERMAGRKDAVLNPFGLGSRSEQKTLYYNELGSGLASLSKRRLEHFGLTFDLSETVEITTLDEYCASRRIERIDLLKLDVEGHELDVLRGGKEALRGGHVRMVTFEFGGCNIDSRTYFRDFWYLLQENKFRYVYRITPSGFLQRIPHYREVDERFVTTNFLACRDEA